MTLSTERLDLTLLSENDAAFILKLLNTEEWKKFIGNRHIQTEYDALNYIKKLNAINNQNTGKIWTVKLKNENIPIGIITYIERDFLEHNDIGFAFLPQFTGCGFAYEAAKKVLEHLTILHESKTVFAITLEENTASIKLIEKLGLKFDKTIEQNNELLQLYKIS